MTLHIVVAVRDQMIATHGRPFCMPTQGAAIRDFQDEINNPQSPMHKHPGDYELMQLGTYDDTTGKFHNMDHKQLAAGRMMTTNQPEGANPKGVNTDEATKR